QSAIAQHLLRRLDATRHEPTVWSRSRGAAKRARKVTHRQATLASYLLEQHTTIEVGVENFLSASYLPRREPTPDWPGQGPHASIGLRNMYPDRQENVVDEQLARLVGMAARRQQRPPEIGNRRVVDTHGLVIEIANARRMGIVRDRVQRAPRHI